LVDQLFYDLHLSQTFFIRALSSHFPLAPAPLPEKKLVEECFKVVGWYFGFDGGRPHYFVFILFFSRKVPFCLLMVKKKKIG